MAMVVVQDWWDGDNYCDDNDEWDGGGGGGLEVKFPKMVQERVWWW